MFYIVTSNWKMSQQTVFNLNQKLGTRREAYNFAATVYYLPSYESSCCSKKYLLQLINEPCHLFKIEKSKISPQHIPYRKHDASFLLEHLEKYLFAHNLEPTGFLSLNPPNIQWLYDVLLYLEPQDPLGLLGGQKNLAEQATILIDPK